MGMHGPGERPRGMRGWPGVRHFLQPDGSGMKRDIERRLDLEKW